MTEHRIANDEIQESASLFATGALAPGEEAAFQEHVQGCDVCTDEARAFRDAVSWLAFTSAPTEPPPSLRDKLMARIRQPKISPGIQIVRSGEGQWHTLVPGVVARRLYADGSAGNVALLVRMEPGAKYPPHSHADVEHCYVLQGDLRFGELVLNTGDYQCAFPSTDHRDSHTVNGCMVLIIASQQNAMLPWTR